MVTNLLSNAVKFTDFGGRVELTCGVADLAPSKIQCPEGVTRWCWIRVADSGIGIRADNFEAIFAPFTQAPSGNVIDPTGRTSYSREHGGTGLGLTISRRLARLMRGDITVESTPGAGSSFTLWLPATVEATVNATEGTYSGEMERRTGTRDARGLALVGRMLRDCSSNILATHVRGLRARFPHQDQLADSDLEDHLDTLLTELALALACVENAAGRPSRLLRDGNAIQRVLAQRHGAQRAALGWGEDELRQEVRMLRQEIEDELRMHISVSDDADVDAALGVIARRLAHVERSTLEGWRKRMNPAAASGSL